MRKKFVSFLFLSLCVSFANYAQDNIIRAAGTNFAHRPGTILRSNSDSLIVKVTGIGKIPVILLTSYMQGWELYQDFVERNLSLYKFFVVTLPGMNGSPAYPWPKENKDFESQAWIRSVEKDLSNFIANNFKERPFVFGIKGESLAVVLHLANDYPDLIQGLILVAGSPFTRFYSKPIDSTKIYDPYAQRNAVSKNFLDFWRTVDEITWHNNTEKANMLTSDKTWGTFLKFNEAKQPIVIRMRYFIEYLYDDLYTPLENCKLPLLAIAPVKNKTDYLSSIHLRFSTNVDSNSVKDAAFNNYLKFIKKDWLITSHPNFRVEFIESPALFVWHDYADRFDAIFNDFINKNRQ